MDLNRRPVASLWIGESLHYVNQLCLKSHLVMGHPVTLYCTDNVRNVPKGVEVRPATEIMDIDRAIEIGVSAVGELDDHRCRIGLPDIIDRRGLAVADCR